MLLLKIDDVAALPHTRMSLDHGRLWKIAWVLHYAICGCNAFWWGSMPQPSGLGQRK